MKKMMKTRDVVLLFNILAKTKVSKIEDETAQLDILRTSLLLQPYAENYQRELDTIRSSYEDNTVISGREKLLMHKEGKDNLLSESELNRCIEVINSYNKKVKTAEQKLCDREIEVSITQVERRPLLEFIVKNEVLTADAGKIIQYMLKK